MTTPAATPPLAGTEAADAAGDRAGLEGLRRPRRRQRRLVRDPGALDRLDHRAQRRRQDDVLQHAHRALQADRRADRLRRQRHLAPAPGPHHRPRHRAHVSEHPPVRDDDGGGERMVGQHARMRAGLFGSILRPPRVRREESDVRAKPRRRSATSGCRSASTTSWRSTSPTATSAASRSPARWPPSRGCCCSTSRPRA